MAKTLKIEALAVASKGACEGVFAAAKPFDGAPNS